MEATARLWGLGTESEQLRDLNERLESYLQRVAVLEKENCSLRNHIEALRPGLDRGKRKELEGLLAAVRQELAEGWRQADSAVLQRDTLLEEMRRVSEQCLREAHVRSVAEMELDERQGWLEDEQKGREELESQVRRLQEEVGKLEESQKEERGALLKELSTSARRCVWSSRAPAPALSSRDLEYCLGEVGLRWTEARELYHEELARVERAVSESNVQQNAVKEEAKNSQLRLQALRGEMEGLKEKRKLMEERLQQQNRARDQEMQQLQTTVGDLEKVKESLTAKMDQILEDQRHLMQMKLALSLELATYRALLNSEADRMNFEAGYRDVDLGFTSRKGPSPLGRLGGGYTWRTQVGTVPVFGSNVRDDLAESGASPSRGDKVTVTGKLLSKPEMEPPSAAEFPRDSAPGAGQLEQEPTKPVEEASPLVSAAVIMSEKPQELVPEPPQQEASLEESPEARREVQGEGPKQAAAGEKKLDGDQKGKETSAKDEHKSAGEILGEEPARAEICKTIMSSEASRTEQPMVAQVKAQTAAQEVLPGEEDAPKMQEATVRRVDSGSGKVAVDEVSVGVGETEPRDKPGQEPPTESSQELGGELTNTEEHPSKEQIAAQLIREDLKTQEPVTEKETVLLTTSPVQEGSPAERSSKLPGDSVQEKPDERSEEEVILRSERKEDVSVEPCVVETVAVSAKEMFLGDKEREVTSILDQHLSAREELSETVDKSEAAPIEQPIEEQKEVEETAEEVQPAGVAMSKTQEATVCGDNSGGGEVAVEEVSVGLSEAEPSSEPGPWEELPSKSSQEQGGEVAGTEEGPSDEPDQGQLIPDEPESQEPVTEKETAPLGSSAAEEVTSPGDSVQDQPEEKGEEEVVLGAETKEDVSEEPCVEKKLPEEQIEEVTSAKDQHVSAGEESAREEISETVVCSGAPQMEQPIAEQEEEEATAEGTSVVEEVSCPGDSVQNQPEEKGDEEVVLGTETKEDVCEEPCVEETATIAAEEERILGVKVTSTEDQQVSAEEVICEELAREEISETIVSSEAAPTEQPIEEQEKEETVAEDVLPAGEDAPKMQEATACRDDSGSGEVAVEEVSVGVSEAQPCGEPGPREELLIEGSQEQGGEVTGTKEDPSDEPDSAQIISEEPEQVTEKETAPLETSAAEEVTSPGDSVREQPEEKGEEEEVLGTETKEIVSEEPCVVETAAVAVEEKLQEEEEEELTSAEDQHVSMGEELAREEISETIESSDAPRAEQSMAEQEKEETAAQGTLATEEVTSPGDSVQEQPEEKGEGEVVLGTETKEDVSEEPCMEEMAPVAVEVEKILGDKEEEVTSTEDQHVSAGEIICEESAREEISKTIVSSEAAPTEQPIEEQEKEETAAEEVLPAGEDGPKTQEATLCGDDSGSGEVAVEEVSVGVSEAEPSGEPGPWEELPIEGSQEQSGEVAGTEEDPSDESGSAQLIPEEPEQVTEKETAPLETSAAEEVTSPGDSVREQPEEKGEKEIVLGTETKEIVSEEPCVVETVVVAVEEKLPEEKEEELTSAEDQHVSVGEESAREEISETIESSEARRTEQSMAELEKEETAAQGTSATEVTSPGDSVQDQPEEKGEEEVVLGTETKEDVSEEPCVEETGPVAAEEERILGDKEEEVTSTKGQHESAGEVICEELVREEISETNVSSEAAPTEQPIEEQEKEETVAEDVLPAVEDAPKTQEATVCGVDSGSGEVAVEEVSVGISEAKPSGEPGPWEELPIESSQEQGGEVAGTEEDPSDEPDSAQLIPEEPEQVTEKETVPLETSAAEEVTSPGDSVREQPEEKGEEEEVLGTETKEIVSEEPCVVAAVAVEEKLPEEQEEELTSAEDQHVSVEEELAREEISETIESSEAPRTKQSMAEQEKEEMVAQGTSATEEVTSPGDSVQDQPEERGEEEVVLGTETKEDFSVEPCMEETAAVAAEEKLPEEQVEEVTSAEDQHVSAGEESAREEISETVVCSEAPQMEQPVAEQEEEETAAEGTSVVEEVSCPGDSVQDQPEEKGEEEVVLGTETKEDVSEEPCVEEMAPVAAEEERILGDKEEEVISTEDQHVSAGEESAREEISETVVSSEALRTEQPIAGQEEEETAAEGTSVVEEVSSPGNSVQEQPEEKGEEEVVLGTETKEDVSEEPCVEETAPVAAEEERILGGKEEEVTSTEDQHVSAGEVICEESAREEISETIVSSEAAPTEQPIEEQEEEAAAEEVLPAGEDAPKTQEATVCGDDSGSGEVVVEEVSVGVSKAEPSSEPGPLEDLPIESSQEQGGEEAGMEEHLSDEPDPAQLIPEESESQEPVSEKETAPLEISAAEEPSSPRDSGQEQPEERSEEEVVLGTETKEDVSEEPCVLETAAVTGEEKLPEEQEEELTSAEDQHVAAGEESAREEISETIVSSEAPRTEQLMAEQKKEETAAQGTLAADEITSPEDSVQEQPEERGEEEVVLGTETKEDVSEEQWVEEAAVVVAEEKLPEDQEELTLAEDQYLATVEKAAREEISETIVSSEAAPTEQPIEEQEEEETAVEEVIPAGVDAPKTQEATVCGDNSGSGEVAVEDVSVGVSEAESRESSQEQGGEVTGTEEHPSDEPDSAQLIPEEPEQVTKKETVPLETWAAEEVTSLGDSVQKQPEERGEEELVLGTETKEDVSGEPCVEEMAAVAAEEKPPEEQEKEVTSAEDQHLSAGEETREEISETIESSEAPLTEQLMAKQKEEEMAGQGTMVADEMTPPEVSVQEQPKERSKEEVVLGTEAKEDVSEELCVEETAAVAAEVKLPEEQEEEVTSAEHQHVSAGVDSAREEISETIESLEAQRSEQPIDEQGEEETAAKGSSAAEEVTSPGDSVQEQPEEKGEEEVVLGTESKEDVAGEPCVEEPAAVAAVEGVLGEQEQEATSTEDQHLSTGEVLCEELVREEISETIVSSVEGQEAQMDLEEIPAEVVELETEELLCGQEGVSACNVEEGLADEDLPLMKAAPLAQPELVEDEDKFGEDEADGGDTAPSGEGAALGPEEVSEPAEETTTSALPDDTEEERSSREDLLTSLDAPSLGEAPSQGGEALKDSPEEALDAQSQSTILLEPPSSEGQLQDHGDIPAATLLESARLGDSNGVEVAEQEGSPGEEEGQPISRLEGSGPGMDGESLTEDQETSPLQREADQSYKGQVELCGAREESKEDSSIASPLDKIDSSIPDPSDANRGSEEKGAPCRREELGTLREPTQMYKDTVERATSPETHHHLESLEDEKLSGKDSTPSITEGTEERGDCGSVDLTLSPLPPSPAQDTAPVDVQDPCPVIPALPEDQPVNGLHDCCETLGKGEGRTLEMIATAYHYCSSEDE